MNPKKQNNCILHFGDCIAGMAERLDGGSVDLCVTSIPFGAKKQLRVHIPYVPGLEDHIWENILRKKSQWEADTAACERAYAGAMKGIIPQQGGGGLE
jgi:DNA modification methylase